MHFVNDTLYVYIYSGVYSKQVSTTETPFTVIVSSRWRCVPVRRVLAGTRADDREAERRYRGDAGPIRWAARALFRVTTRA